MDIGRLVRISRCRAATFQLLKLLFLTAVLLPSLVPAGFMAHRNAESGELVLGLCPSVFSASDLAALGAGGHGDHPPQDHSQHASHDHHKPHHNPHHSHHQPVVIAADDIDPLVTDEHAGHKSGASQQCPLALPGAAIAELPVLASVSIAPSVVVVSAPVVTAATMPLLPPPVRGPPNLS